MITYRLETPKGEILATGITRKELREITSSTSYQIIDVFDEETDEFLGEFDPQYN